MAIKLNDPAKKSRSRRGWMEIAMDPDGSKGIRQPSCSKKENDRHKRYSKMKSFRKQLFSDRKLKQWERLEWVADKIIQSWPMRKIHLEFARTFGMDKHSSCRYVERIYKDFQEQFTDPAKRNLLLAEHCASLREGMRRCLVEGNLDAFNSIARQYAETAGILTPAHLLKFQVNNNDNRQQMLVGNLDEAKMTLTALEQLSEQDLFKKAIPILEATRPAPESE